jgi:alpha-amylase
MQSRRHLYCGLGVVLIALGCDHTSAPAAAPAAPEAATISFEVAHAIVGVRANVKLNPTIRDAQGQDITASAAVQWKTSDASFATVNDTGTVTGVRLGGPVTITATANGHSASVVYTVTPARIDITPSVSTLVVNGTVRYSGVALDGFGQPLDAGAVTWSSSDIGVARIDQTGLVTGIAAGNALITASAGGRSSSQGLLVGVPSVYDGTFASTTPGVQLVVLFGAIVHFDASFTPLSICTVSVTAALNFPINAAGTFQVFLATGTGTASVSTQLVGSFGSADSVTGTVFGPMPLQCMQGVNNPAGIQYGQFVAHKY